MQSIGRAVYSGGKVVKLAGTFQNIDKYKRAEAALQVSHEKYRVLFESFPLGISISDKSGKIIEGNRQAEELLGITREAHAQRRIDSKEWQIIRKDGTPMPAAEYASTRALRENRLIENIDMCIVKDKGEITWISVTAAPIPLEGYGVAITYGDITERKQAESQREAALEALHAALAGKEVLLKEVHHRVKNNLAAIIGLLQLQREMVTDPAAVAQFIELEGRIRSMALVHETLYGSESLARIELQDFLEALIAKLRAALALGRDVRIDVSATGVEMGLDCAIPCGLILNELLTNAFKYAFPGGQPRAGEKTCAITITAAWDGNAGDNGVYTLTVADNGVGLPVDLDWAKTKTLGLRLVRMLGEYQLKGRIELDRSQGTSFRLVFASRQREKG
ncbi:MAG: PAS domain S-box protein [Candidatus Aminicenantes bacterium]|nr:PAS domain S-box protein [Candidatus Aminicenantes bacterium]